MHGRPRQAPSAATQEELDKIKQYNKHKTAALVAAKNRVYNPTTLALTSAILALNPDLNTLYNYRKEQAIDLLFKGEMKPIDIYKQELDLSTTSLKKNPKSYGGWYHRIWCLEHGKGIIDIQSELQLTEKFLSMDSRNFHCWNYRRYLARTMMGLSSPYDYNNRSQAEINNEKTIITFIASKYSQHITNHDTIITLDQFTTPLQYGDITPENELFFTQTMIENDFSNYSAWHYRSLLLPVIIMRKFLQLPLTTKQAMNSNIFTTFFGFSQDKYQNKEQLKQLLSLGDQFESILNTFSSHNNNNTNDDGENNNNNINFIEQFQPELLIKFLSLYFQYVIMIIQIYFEFDLSYLQIAITMSPNDQSPWLYQRWLLSMIQQLTSQITSITTTSSSSSSLSSTTEINTNDTSTTSSLSNNITDTISKFVQTTFIPNSDNNVHYTDLILDFTNPNLQSKNQLLSYTLFHTLIAILHKIQQSLPESTTSSLTTLSSSPSQQFLSLLSQSVQTPLPQLDANDTTTKFTLDDIIASNQKITPSSFLSFTCQYITTHLHSILPNISNVILTQFIYPIYTLQLQIVTNQYRFFTMDLLPMVSDQIASQRQVLLGIVILKLTITSILSTQHIQLQQLLLNNNNNNDNNNQQYISFVQSKDILQQLLQQQIIQTPDGQDNTIAIVHLLITIDNDRKEYYRELEQAIKQVQM